MDVLTQQTGTDGWIPWPNVSRGLHAAVGDSPVSVLLYCVDPRAELDELTSAVRLIRRRAAPGTTVVVASPLATGDWLDEVRMAGADAVWLLEESGGRLPGRLRLNPVREIPAPPPAAERAPC